MNARHQRRRQLEAARADAQKAIDEARAALERAQSTFCTEIRGLIRTRYYGDVYHFCIGPFLHEWLRSSHRKHNNRRRMRIEQDQRCARNFILRLSP